MKREYVFIFLLIAQSNRCMESGSISQSMDRLPVDSSSSDPEVGRWLPPLEQLRSMRIKKMNHKGLTHSSPWCKRVGYSAFLVTTWVLILTLWHLGTETNSNLVDLRGELKRDRGKIDEALGRFDIVQDTCDCCMTKVDQLRYSVASVPEDVLEDVRKCGVVGQQIYDVMTDIKKIVIYRK